MGSKRRHFSAEFRRDAVQQVNTSGRPVTEVAAELGVDHRTLWHWVNQARIAAIDPAGELTLEAIKRIRELEKENALLRREIDFQKKAQAFFRELDQQRENGSR
jgi:transposase